MTMSISSAPAATDAADFRETLRERGEPGRKPGGDRGDGNARALERLHGRRARSVIDADRARPGWEAATAPIASSRSARTGRRALAQSRRTRPGVSSPESVVRSIRVTARSSHAACHSFLTRAPGAQRRRAALDGAAVDPRPPRPSRARAASRDSGVPPARPAARQATARRMPCCGVSAIGSEVTARNAASP